MKPLKHFHLPNHRQLNPHELPRVYQRLRKKFGHQHWWPGDTAFEIIIGAILTQNTAWTNVERAIHNLKTARLLTPQALKKIPPNRLAKLIQPAGYFNVKTKRLKNFIRFLFHDYKGNLRKMFQTERYHLRAKLLSVNGIGPETADSILLYAGQKPFFVIDAYTKRIFSRHKLLAHDADYAEWQKLFEDHLERKAALYNDCHAQIVHLGKVYCRTSPQCTHCPLNTPEL